MLSVSRLLEPEDGKKPAEKQSVKNFIHTWKHRPQYVGAIRVNSVTVEQRCLRIMDRAVEQQWVKIYSEK